MPSSCAASAASDNAPPLPSQQPPSLWTLAAVTLTSRHMTAHMSSSWDASTASDSASPRYKPCHAADGASRCSSSCCRRCSAAAASAACCCSALLAASSCWEAAAVDSASKADSTPCGWHAVKACEEAVGWVCVGNLLRRLVQTELSWPPVPSCGGPHPNHTIPSKSAPQIRPYPNQAPPQSAPQ